MNRFSRPWWITLAFSSVTVATVGYLLLGQLTDWSPASRILAALAIAALVDLRTAKWMESIAPTRVSVGPGEKARKMDATSDIGFVVSGFNESRRGTVSIRGEIWRAHQVTSDPATLSTGNAVRVIDREGLILMVSARGASHQSDSHFGSPFTEVRQQTPPR